MDNGTGRDKRNVIGSLIALAVFAALFVAIFVVTNPPSNRAGIEVSAE